MNGNGKPFTGIIPETIAQLTKIWDKNIDDIPINIKPENLSEAFNDRLRTRYIKMLNKIIIINKATKPSSSPMTLTIKSDSWTGRNLSWVCVPSPHPLPHKPPEPSAVLLCII